MLPICHASRQSAVGRVPADLNLDTLRFRWALRWLNARVLTILDRAPEGHRVEVFLVFPGEKQLAKFEKRSGVLLERDCQIMTGPFANPENHHPQK